VSSVRHPRRGEKTDTRSCTGHHDPHSVSSFYCAVKCETRCACVDPNAILRGKEHSDDCLMICHLDRPDKDYWAALRIAPGRLGGG
jgi:hypothetical protein